MNRFIVLVEFSEASKHLLKLALKLSARENAEIVVLHQPLDAIPMVTDSEMADQLKKDHGNSALEELKKLAGDIFLTKQNVSYKVSREHLSEQVMKLHDAEKTDFVIAGIRPKSLPDRLFMNSTAVRLADHTERIIIGIPEGQSELRLDNLCVALNSKYPLNTDAFDTMLSLEDKVKSIVFVTALEDHEEINSGKELLEKVSAQYISRYEVSTLVLRGNSPWIELEGYLSRNPALLVLQRGPRNFNDILRRFFVNRFIYAATRPVVVLPLRGF